VGSTFWDQGQHNQRREASDIPQYHSHLVKCDITKGDAYIDFGASKYIAFFELQKGGEARLEDLHVTS